MVLWWIANLVLLLVVAPVVIWLANKLVRPAREILAYSNDILEHGHALTGALDALPALDRTRQLASEANRGASRYGAALQRIQ
ncbi:MAG: hypothetical protein M3378_12235 [Actinomycetota bacterium]|nr:hypothetical protein [Actinomycetota bacterium]MDQ3681283.1 hypothetical protein [Actinomycetota bacterium]